ncbi:nuclear factor 7, ovary-like [Dicentrarchus labrax]|uniref:Zinc-binding protein A33-like n=1 Tax=Dicentrarchus labrax TaxID=13489 RepID=A0A8P4GD93_DICLA|nr:nuclear factor 7, ovary-like [Dicentrarchus labrax]
MAFSWSVPSNELSCSICQDTFKDPVLLPCGHSFCKVCVQQWWRTKQVRECPVCKTVSSTNRPPRNLVLKNLCEAFLLEVESGVVCRQHAEKLKLYCLDHRTPVCVVCRDSNEHRNHSFTPVDEAANGSREDLLENLKPLREKVKLFNEMKVSWEKTDEEIRNQAQDTEEKIRNEFDVLKVFLQTEERARIAALKQENEIKRAMVKNKIAVLSREINAMESTIKSIEGGLKEDDPTFLFKVGDLKKEAQRPLMEDPKQMTGALIDVGKYLGNIRFSVWYKMKYLVSFTPVILNPNTAHRELQLSEGLTNVKCGPKQPLNVLLHTQPERMHQHRSVLGCEGFSSGRHSWDVKVGDNQVWALGVMAQEAQMKGDLLSGLWMLRFSHGKFTAFSPSCAVTVLPLKDRLQKVRVHLDWDKGKLTFLNPDTAEVVHTFTHTFTDRLFPYINTWKERPVKILPLNISVIVT